MRIVFFIDHLRHDGTQRVLKQLVEGLAARGHEQAVVCFNDSWDDALVNDLKRARVQVRVVGKWTAVSGWGLVSTWRWLKQNKFDVAVTLLYVADLLGRPLAHFAGIPRIVSSLRARNTNYSALKRSLTQLTMRWADHVVINSRAVQDFAIAGEGAPAEKIIYIPNGVVVENYTRPITRTQLRAELGISSESYLMGTIGRLALQKGLDILLQAMSGLQQREVHLLVVGTGNQEPELRGMARNLGMEARVHFVGYRHDVPQILGALDLYVHPARWEGMPNAVLEAMAAGCPIVATSADGTSELIPNDTYGWLVPPENVDALTRAIDTAIMEPHQARECGVAAQRRANEFFSVKAMVDAWEQVLARSPSVQTH